MEQCDVLLGNEKQYSSVSHLFIFTPAAFEQYIMVIIPNIYSATHIPECRKDAREARAVQPAQARGAQPQVERACVRPDTARAAGGFASALRGGRARATASGRLRRG